MKAILQRVWEAQVSIAGEVVGKIEKGLLVLVGFEESDTFPMNVLFQSLTCAKNIVEFKVNFKVNWGPAGDGLATDDCDDHPCLCLFEAFGY